ncbi:cold shock and DUF1294 domain-containing protein [Shewanella algae]|uniref:DUF1294 domain-containing protein n=1 Tax=Shewanella algae TaxID=38313 RepID=UPI001AACC542|nr:cold shock and DUF1294 domain-containing protein [Shewanella algae]MBO2674099.1 cold shock and DUF1294 domain-containing protein [Shewanella algae]
MKHKGKVSHWQDDKGFGFISPNDGSERVFLHIKSLSLSGRRPQVGDVLTFKITLDDRGRRQAQQAFFPEDRGRLKQKQRQQNKYSSHKSFVGKLTALFALLLLALVALGKLPLLVPVWYLLLSLLCYWLYARDKKAAETGRWRTKESTLQLTGLLGGWPGALLARHQFRHKTSKTSFRLLFWCCVGLNLLALGTALKLGWLGWLARLPEIAF